MTDEKRFISEEEFLGEMRLRTLEAAAETTRLLRTDAEITESLRDIILTVQDEIAREPKLFFRNPGGTSVKGTGSIQPSLSQEEAKGGKVNAVSEIPVGSIGNVILDLVKEEKELIKELIGNLFNF
jgi:hypothetical protein